MRRTCGICSTSCAALSCLMTLVSWRRCSLRTLSWCATLALIRMATRACFAYVHELSHPATPMNTGDGALSGAMSRQESLNQAIIAPCSITRVDCALLAKQGLLVLVTAVPACLGRVLVFVAQDFVPAPGCGGRTGV